MPKLRLPKFRLRTLLVLLTVACIWVGWLARRTAKQREAVQAIGQKGQIYFHHQFSAPFGKTARVDVTAEPTGPSSLRALLGDDYFQTVRRVDFAATDELMEELPKLPDLETVMIDASALSDDGLRYLQELPKLKKLIIENGHKLSNSAFAHIGQLTHLEILWIKDVPVDDEALTHLEGLDRLKDVVLQDTLATREGAQQLDSALPAAGVFLRGTEKYSSPP